MPGIFLRREDELVALTEAPYSAEDLLQELVARHPQLLLGGEGGGDLLLVRREAGISDAVDAAARWSLDHLFLDGDGVPVLVEVKRSSDTRIRREVVGQMLEDEVRQLAMRLAELGVPDIFVVAGDVKERVGLFDGGLALLEELASFDHGITSIGIPVYPETHPMLAEDALFAALDSKQRYATYMVSQICFDPARTLEWLRAVRMRGVALPLYVGIAGPMKMRRLMATSLRIGVGASARFLSKQGELATRLISGYRPDHLVEALAPYVGDRDHGIAGFHINTFNQVDATVDWLCSITDGRGDRILGGPWKSVARG